MSRRSQSVVHSTAGSCSVSSRIRSSDLRCSSPERCRSIEYRINRDSSPSPICPFDQVILGPDFHRFQRGLFVVEAGEHDQRHIGMAVVNADARFNPCTVGKAEVHQHDIKSRSLQSLQSISERFGRIDLEICRTNILEADTNKLGIRRAVLDEEHPDGRAGHHQSC